MKLYHTKIYLESFFEYSELITKVFYLNKIHKNTSFGI